MREKNYALVDNPNALLGLICLSRLGAVDRCWCRFAPFINMSICCVRQVVTERAVAVIGNLSTSSEYFGALREAGVLQKLVRSSYAWHGSLQGKQCTPHCTAPNLLPTSLNSPKAFALHLQAQLSRETL